jgi:predicted SAM-dependent methyltransferase
MLPLEGYINVDMRELPGVDVVARVDDLPFDPGSISELSSAHTLEHFPQEQLVRHLLPYWYSLLAEGGVFRATVPDIGAMMEQVRTGAISFDDFRLVAYGGQEYEGDFHHTGFTTESLGELLAGAGFTDIEVVEQARPNGTCLEFEIVARRPG